MRWGGSISLPGMYVEDSAPVPIGDMWLKNITITAGVANVQDHMDELIELIRDGRIDPAQIISHRMPLSDAAEGYELFDSKEALKVVLDPMLEGQMQDHSADASDGAGADARQRRQRGRDAHRRRPGAGLVPRGGGAGRQAGRGARAARRKAEDRVATFMWNSQQHLEVYLAAPNMGAVLHTLNIRLFPEQLVYIVNHARDKVIIVDDSLIPLLAPVATSSSTSSTTS